MFEIAPLPQDWLPTFGVLSAALSIGAYGPYIRDTLRGGTEPQRASWLIWSCLSVIAFCGQMAEGASQSLWFAGAQMTGTVTVTLLSIRRGKGSFLTRPDERMLWLALIGLIVWYFTETAAYALAMTITISLLGGTLTVAKAYRAPETETASTWTLSFIASCCAIVSVGTLDWVLLAYPLYLFTLNGAIICALALGRAAAGVQPVK
ncbi:MAG: hypothetical protein AAGM84_18405 [Pseudomonadota bacterium]